MRTVTATLVVLAGMCVSPRAETLEFPLAGFAGGFDTYRTGKTYTGEAKQVVSVSLRITASIDQVGKVFCIHAPGVPEEYWGPCIHGPRIGGGVWKNDDRTGTFFDLKDRIVREAGDYDRTPALDASPGFDGLNAGDVINVKFRFEAGDWCCLPAYPIHLVETEATLTGVTLLIDVADPVPVEHTTWGRIKSLYDRR